MQRKILRLGVQARAALKPTALSVLLFGLTVLLFGALAARSRVVYSPDRSTMEEVRIGPGPALRFVTDESAAGHRTSRTEISWPPLLACVLSCYLGSRGVAYLVERRRMGRPILVLSGVIAATLLLAAGAAAVFSFRYWGYAFARPEPDGLGEFAVVTGLSGVTCNPEPRPRCTLSAAEPVREIVSSCQKDPYYCLRERFVFALTRAGLPPADNRPAPAGITAPIESFLAATDLLAEHEPGYEDRTLAGLVVTGRSVDGQSLAAIAISGRQVSNDHYPHYEVLLGLEKDGYHPLSQRRFFYDVAGMEGLEWWPAFLGMSVLGLLGSVALTVVILLVRRGRITSSSPEGHPSTE